MENKRMKHGLISVAITAGVLAGVILANILFSFLAGKFLWVIDTTPSELVTISDYSEELLSEIDAETNDITIYFLADPDELMNYELTGHKKGENNSTWGMSYIYNLAKLYEKEFPYIKVSLLDSSDDADYIREHFAMSIGTSLGPLHIVMENRVNGLATYRTMQRDEFFTFSGDAMYFRGDDKFTSTVLSLSGENPVAYFIGGHGEDIGALDDSEDFGKAKALMELFRDAGYVIEKIDLSTRDFPADVDDALYGRAGVAVIYGPRSDFKTDADGSVNEITRLRKYLNRKNHNLMVFMDPETEAMPHLDEYLYDYWGIAFEDNILTVDTKNPVESGAVTDDGYNYYARYETDTKSPGSALTSSLLTLETLPRAFFGKSRTIYMNPKWSNNEESTMVMEGVTSYKVGAAFLAPAKSAAHFNHGGYTVYDPTLYEEYTANYYKTEYDRIYPEMRETHYERAYNDHYKNNLEAYQKDGLSDEEIAEKCRTYAEDYVKEQADLHMASYLKLAEATPSGIMTLTHAAWMYQSGETVSSYAMACGTTDFAAEEAIDNASFSNRDILFTAIYLFGKNVLPYDIDIIKVQSTSSLNISSSMAIVWTVILAAVIPVGVIAAGVTVTVKRRRHN